MPLPDGGVYTRLALDGERFGGAMEMHVGTPPAVPSYWLAYFGVDDLDATFGRVLANGGSEMLAPTPMPGGRFAIVRDPQGGVFALLHGD